MSRDPLRVLILLPLLLAGFATVPAISPAAAMPGDSRIVAPNVMTHSVGPNPGHSLSVDDTISFDIRVEDVGELPEDMDGWNLVGSLDPSFFRILTVQDGDALDAACLDMGGSTLYRASVDLRSGEWAASELCAASLPHPTDMGFTGSGVLVTLNVRVLQVGVSSIDLDEAASFLRDIDGFDSMSIAAGVYDGSFDNTPAESADFSGQAATASPRSVSLGDIVTFHATVQSSASVPVIVEFQVLRPSGAIDAVIAGPDTQGSMFVEYMTTETGFHQVFATAYWSEDGGTNYIYAGHVESNNLDFTAH